MRVLLLLLGCVVGITVLILGINFYLSPSGELKKADVIVAVSGGDTEARATRAAGLYTQGYADKILFSGAALDPLSPSNAKAMKRVALEAGVHGADVLVEETSSNTEENAKHSQSILDSDKYKTIILVTSPYHQRRAYLEFSDKLDKNVEIINHPSSDKDWPTTWWLTPRGWWLGLSELSKTAITAAKNVF